MEYPDERSVRTRSNHNFCDPETHIQRFAECTWDRPCPGTIRVYSSKYQDSLKKNLPGTTKKIKNNQHQWFYDQHPVTLSNNLPKIKIPQKIINFSKCLQNIDIEKSTNDHVNLLIMNIVCWLWNFIFWVCLMTI